MLADSVADFTTRRSPVERMRRLKGAPPGYEKALWKEISELGWVGILVPSEHGGLDLGFPEMRMVLEGLAKTLVPEPLCATAVLAAVLLRNLPSGEVRDRLLSEMAGGACRPVVAWQEAAGSLELNAGGCRLDGVPGAARLNGRKQFVHGAAGSDGYLVSAMTAANEACVLWIPADAGSVKVEHLLMADGRQMAGLGFEHTPVVQEHVVATGLVAKQALERMRDAALIMIGAELCGVMRGAIDLALNHLRTRKQFGKPIGAFQALAHRTVDLFIQLQLSMAVVDEAVKALQRADDDRTTQLASRAKARCSAAALRITRETIQIFGAMGFADECDVGLYVKRAVCLSAWFGNATFHQRRYARLCIVGKQEAS